MGRNQNGEDGIEPRRREDTKDDEDRKWPQTCTDVHRLFVLVWGFGREFCVLMSAHRPAPSETAGFIRGEIWRVMWRGGYVEGLDGEIGGGDWDGDFLRGGGVGGGWGG